MTQDENPSALLTSTHSTSVDVETGAEDHHKVRDYRKLAICSIICGLSCVGIVSLIYSVKTREINKITEKPSKKAKEYSRKTLKWGVIALVASPILIVLIILLLGLLSFLLTFIN